MYGPVGSDPWTPAAIGEPEFPITRDIAFLCPETTYPLRCGLFPVRGPRQCLFPAGLLELVWSQNAWCPGWPAGRFGGERLAVVEAGEQLEGACCFGVVVDVCDVGEMDRFGDVVPEAFVAGADAVFGDVMATVAYAGSDSVDAELDRDEDDVEVHRVAGCLGGSHEFDLGGVREDGLGDERGTGSEHLVSALGGELGGLDGELFGDRTAAGEDLGDLVGVDERKSGGLTDHSVVERRLAGTVGTGDQVEVRHVKRVLRRQASRGRGGRW